MSGPLRTSYQRLRTTRAARWVSRTFFQRPDAGAALWTLVASEDRPHVDVLRMGACEFQEMNECHTVTAPIGYPKYMADALACKGVGFGFQNIFVWNLEDWPSEHTLVKRRQRMDGRAPDVVLLQVGGWVAMRHFLGFNHRIVALRENFSRWVGPLIWPVYPIIVFFLRRYGRGMPEQGPGALEEFIAMLRRRWPDTRIVIMEPWGNGMKGAFDEARLGRVTDLLRDVARRLGCEWMPAPDFGPGRRLRCANGFNLNRAGSIHAGQQEAAWLLDHDCVSRPPTDPGDPGGGRLAGSAPRDPGDRVPGRA